MMDGSRDRTERATEAHMTALVERFRLGLLPFDELVAGLAQLCAARRDLDILDRLLTAAVARGTMGRSLARAVAATILATPARPAAPARHDPEESLLDAFVGGFRRMRDTPEPPTARDGFGASLDAYDGLRQRRYAREAVQGTRRAPLQAAPAAELSPGAVLRDRFILDAELGRGGMGIVYRAVDRRRLEAGARQPYVAIKVLNLSFGSQPDALRALEAEARRTQELADPRIVTVYDFDRDGAHAFIVMELLEGLSLDHLVFDEPRFPGSALAQKLVFEMVETLAVTHARGAVHADLKLANLFLCSEGRLKVLDFGISAAIGGVDPEDSPAGLMTPAYASPEREQGAPPTPSDDVYALGCLVHLLLTGNHPFDRLGGLDAKARGRRPPPLPQLLPDAENAVRRALSFDAAHRFPDAGAFLDALTAAPAQEAAR